MADDENRQASVKFLHELREKGKTYPRFEESVNVLQAYIAASGLDNEEIKLLVDLIVHTDLGATKVACLIKCLVPRYMMPEEDFKRLVTWCLSAVDKLPVTVSTIIIQWIVGVWDYQLVDRKFINIYYDVLFFVMLKKKNLERHIARLIYVLTKPEDVTRRNVSRLLFLHTKYTKAQKHIIALLSLFKSYKPELVPEKIQSINVKSVWKPVPEVLRLQFKVSRDRMERDETRCAHPKYFKWNRLEASETKKKGTPLLPSVGYFQIGSRIFQEKDEVSIFDVSNIEELGKSHLNIELPSNAVSLLANMAGYHLLTYADFQYQSRFSYNLYNTLLRGFILENGKFSVQEMERLLDMTAEFSRYMQQGILVVNLFLDEYLYFNTGEHQRKLLALLQWMIFVSVAELKEKVLSHVQTMFYESSLSMKCEIIRTLRRLITNLFVNQGFSDYRQTVPGPFLGQGPIDSIEDVLPVITKTAENLIVSGLNIHFYDTLLLSEALSFYEQVFRLEDISDFLSLTLAPPAVIYGAFATRSCAILSRVCQLILRYRDKGLEFRKKQVYDVFKNKIYAVSIYARDIVTALWLDQPFAKRKDAQFLKDFSENTMKDLDMCDLNSLLNITNHYAMLPCRYTLRRFGLDISTKEDAMSLAEHYYPPVSELLCILQS